MTTMITRWLTAGTLATLLVGNGFAANSAPNALSATERQDGWQLLWDGTTSRGWQSIAGKDFPAQGWEIKDGTLTVLGQKGGDIITTQPYRNFELRVEFRITPGANSGIKYFINPAQTKAVGYEFQILDDAKHPDAKLGINGNRTIGSLYDILPARADKQVNPPGEWNQALIIVKGKHVEHWLNGAKVVAFDRDSPEFQAHFAASKFKGDAGFCARTAGHILLQDHGNVVSYRNLKLRPLPE